MTLTLEKEPTIATLMAVDESARKIEWLKEMLQAAVDLEFATIPHT